MNNAPRFAFSYKIGWSEVEVPPHVVQVGHGPVVGCVDRLADAWLLSLHEAQFVHGVVQPHWHQFVSRQPLPEEKVEKGEIFDVCTFVVD